MKTFLATTLALGAAYICEMNPAAQALTRENATSDIYLARAGGGHIGGHGFENRNEGHNFDHAGDRGDGMGAGAAEGAGEAAKSSSPPAAADRMHTLNNDAHTNEAKRWDEYGGWGTAGGLGLDINEGCAEVDSNGNCIRSQ